GVVALDVALVLRAEAFDGVVVAGELAASAADVDGVAADELLLAWVLEILPARHPPDCGIGDAVRPRRLAQQLRKIAVARTSVEMLTQVSADLSAGVGDA